jgi:alkaline phosphatase D
MDLENPRIPDPDAHSRRRFLQRTSGAATLAAVGTAGHATAAMDDQGRFTSDPFSLGVASGDPLPDSVILWTRLVPEPFKRGGGMPDQSVPVQWIVAADEDMREIVQTGEVFAQPEHAHSVHVDVTGLKSNTEYYYQFRTSGRRSPVGRTKTAPATGASLDEFSFAFASCQAWYNGFYTAYKHMAKDELDLIIHLGDYIYEYGIGPNGGERNTSVPQVYRTEPKTLDRYRLQYGLYKSDPDLQAAHASAPWIVTFDDHEVDNNWADEDPQDPDKQSVREFLQRRANGLQAYFEHMPLRPSRMPDGPDMPVYRNFTFGNLAEFNILDTRQYRSDQACGGGAKKDCKERLDPSRTILGDAQEEWLLDNLGSSAATWDIIANQVLMAEMDFDRGPEEALSMDKWDGYIADRNRVLTTFEQEVRNPVVITGDFHRNFANNLKKDFDDPDSATIGTEFLGTSISSGKNGTDMDDFGRRILAENEHIKYHNAQRGYVRCTLTPDQWRTDYQVVPYVTDRGAPIHTDASFVVEDGNPGLQER